MTGRELLLEALRGAETPRPAWVPFVGCHGGKLIGVDAATYLRSADALCAGIDRAIERYRPDGIPILFDLQVEAEVLGCRLQWAADVPPAVTSHPLLDAGLDALPDFGPDRGRLPLIREAMHRLLPKWGDRVAFYGLVCGPFTLALHLLGNEIFLQMFDDPAGVRTVIDACATVAIRSAEHYRECGAEVIAVVDPMTSQISAQAFADFVTPSVNRVFDGVRATGARSALFVCGDANRNLPVMCATRADSLSVDEQIPIPRLRELCTAAGKSFGGNMRLTSVLLLGSADDARLETLSILDAAGPRGFVLSPGCDLPYHTPPANLEAVAELVHDPYKREVARHAAVATAADTFADVQPPVYAAHREVIVDVITLDSTSCAPCQYMMEAVHRAAKEAFVKVFVNEHKIKDRRGIGMMHKLGVQNLPTICIDGEVAFASLIPDHRTLVAAFERCAVAKNRPGEAVAGPA